MKYKEHKQVDYAKIGETVRQWWKEENTFEKSVSDREGQPTFTFYEGPPSANGTPGIHHVMARTVKDVFCRYKTMQGFQVKRKGGWDTHGLPVELEVEKELGITKEDIGKSISVEEYNQKCREAVMKYKGEWDELTEKMGYWVDLNDPYITFDRKYMETLWSLLKKLYEKGLLYKGYTIQPYSPAAGTGLSSHELNQPGTYKDVKDTSIVAQFKVKGTENDYFLAWTTTPWTLPSNSALAVGEKITYVKIKTFNPYTFEPVNVILAKDLVGKFFSEKAKEVDFKDYNQGDKLIPFKVVEEYKGSDLVGKEYEQLMPYVTPDEPAFRVIPGDFVSTEDGTGIVHIAPTFGADDQRVAQQAGIPPIVVKDELGNDAPLVNKQGKFVDEVDEFAGKYVKEAYENPKDIDDDYKSTDVLIAIKLKEENKAFKVEKYEHSYPHCWRTDKPVLYYPLESWFIKTTACKDRLVALNKTINWKPESTGSGRFGNWLENLVDWNLSRSRYWGTPLPIWRKKYHTPPLIGKQDFEYCVGSIDEFLNPKLERTATQVTPPGGKTKNVAPSHSFYILMNDDLPEKIEDANNLQQSISNHLELGKVIEELINKNSGRYLKKINSLDQIKDLHRPYVDSIVLIEEFPDDVLNHPGQPKYEAFFRESDLIDVWFDSGAMPYAQWHYPFENEAIFNKNFPADFIAEGVDQTRGWFFTLHALAVMLYDSVAFKNVIANGLVLDKKGNKMSKRFGNAIDPFATIDQYGPDATRWYMMENAPPWDNLKFDLDGVQEVQRKFFGTLQNTYNFFALYANLDSFSFSEAEVPMQERTESDNWIISKLNSLAKDVAAAYEDYEPTKAARLIQDFTTDDLSNWYVRLNRKRFWKGEYNQDKIAAYQTLYSCLETIVKLSAPIAPFYSEFLFRELNNVSKRDSATSIHLAKFPAANDALIKTELEEKMNMAQTISSLVHSIRKKHTIKVRQPLSKILVPVLSEQSKSYIQAVEDIILSEVNVKEVEYMEDASGVIVKKVKPNFKKLGSQYGPKMKSIAGAIAQLTNEDIVNIEKANKLDLAIEGETISLTLDDLEISSEDIPGWSVASENGLTVALDINITDDLRQEGIARDLVNRIQNMRKDMGLEVQDKIKITVKRLDDLIDKALESNKEYICNETQALQLDMADDLVDGKSVQIDDHELFLKIEA